MNNFPTIKIAMFGARSTGKTNFLASLVGVDPVQGCHIDFLDSNTRKILQDNWERITEGEVPDATPMTDEQPLELNFCQKVQDYNKDEWGWKVIIKDYAGKLMESESELEDSITQEILEKLSQYINEADAILFLAPVDIGSWRKPEQERYVIYIKKCISIAKEKRSYGRSIPFCLALMKWDMTGIAISSSAVVSGKQTLDSQVAQFLEQNEVFNRFYTVINDLSNQDVALFPISSYGSHNPENNKKPDPGNLCPINVIQTLHWICSNVDTIRLTTLKRRIADIDSQDDTDEKFSAIQQAYNDFLNDGVNDPNIEKECRKKQEENHEKHIQFNDKDLASQFEKIDNDKRCRNSWKEKAALYRDKLSRNLYRPSEERDLRHNLEELEVQSKKRDRQIIRRWAGGILCSIIAIVVLCVAVIMFSWTSSVATSFANGEQILAKSPENYTAQDFRAAETFFGIPQCPFENSIFFLKGRREKFFETKQKFINDNCRIWDEGINQYVFGKAFSDRAKTCGAIIAFVKSKEKDSKMFPDIYASKYQPLIDNWEKEKQYWENAHRLEIELKSIQSADDSTKLAKIEKTKHFNRLDFKSPETEMFSEIDREEKAFLEALQQRLESQLQLYTDEEIEPNDFIKLEKNARKRAESLGFFADFYPESYKIRAELQSKAEKDNKTAADLTPYLSLQNDFDSIVNSTLQPVEQKQRAETFIAKYNADAYPRAKTMIDRITGIIQSASDEIYQKFLSEYSKLSDSDSDSLDTRINNSQKRTSLCDDYMQKLEKDSEPWKAINNHKPDEIVLIEKLEKWKVFEEKYLELSSTLSQDGADQDKMDKCTDFISEFSSMDYQDYSNFQEYIDKTKQNQSELAFEITVADMKVEVEKYEKEMKDDPSLYQKHQNTGQTLVNDLGLIKNPDNRIRSFQERVNKALKDNEISWEAAEFEKLINSWRKLKENPNVQQVRDSLTVAKGYLDYPNAGKISQDNWDKAKKINAFLENITETRKRDIIVVWYNVDNTDLDNWFLPFSFYNWSSPLKLLFRFTIEGRTYEVKHTGGHIQEINQKITVNESCTIDSVKLTVKNLEKNPEGTTTFKPLDYIFGIHEMEPLKINVNGKSATVALAVPDFPIMPDVD